jgi:hypothetical protein
LLATSLQQNGAVVILLTQRFSFCAELRSLHGRTAPSLSLLRAARDRLPARNRRPARGRLATFEPDSQAAAAAPLLTSFKSHWCSSLFPSFPSVVSCRSFTSLKAVLRIRNVYPGSDLSIPDPNFFHPDPGSASKNLIILTQKMVSKL